MSVGRICTRVVYTTTPTEKVRHAARLMLDYNVGSLVVVELGGAATGLLTDRDIAIRCVAENLDPDMTPVSKIMTAAVATCTKADTVDTVSVLMTTQRVRHVPVLDGKKLIGIVSIGDVVKTRMEELEAQQQQLHSYITQG